jgi:hypothetical protein
MTWLTWKNKSIDTPACVQAPIPKKDAEGHKHYPPWPIDRIVEWSRTARGGKQVDFFGGDATAMEGCMRWGLCDTATPDGDDAP